MSAERWPWAQWEAASVALWERSGGVCEACGVVLLPRDEVARHHRQRRAVGGDRLSNLVLLHGDCHRRVHAHPERARESGLIVSAYVTDPATVPLWLGRGGWVQLDDSGGRLSVGAPE